MAYNEGIIREGALIFGGSPIRREDMAVSKAQQKATNKYISKVYDRINLTVPKGNKDVIQAHAEAHSESVNAFINRAISEAMERDNATRGPREGTEKPQTVDGSGRG